MDGFSGWNSPGTTILLAFLLLAALAFVALGSMAGRQPLARPKKIPSLSNLVIDANAPPGKAREVRPNPLRKKSRRERREALRRGGNPVAVRLTDSHRDTVTLEGLVQDRSRGGLLVAAPKPAAVGSLCWVRAVHAPEEGEWVPIQIRHCRQQDDRWLWGCKFTCELPWSVLLLFG
ncbi:MAG: PilZ domain-containing protein [Gemmataceae bacterium]|nr:PilZ domain-containing protein [Gemmataceae bacterium]